VISDNNRLMSKLYSRVQLIMQFSSISMICFFAESAKACNLSCLRDPRVSDLAWMQLAGHERKGTGSFDCEPGLVTARLT
jgi:hypothetical protein